jgi:hypothetical protein
MATVTGRFSIDVLKKKRKEVGAACGRLYNTLIDAVSNWDLDDSDDSEVLANLQ